MTIEPQETMELTKRLDEIRTLEQRLIRMKRRLVESAAYSSEAAFEEGGDPTFLLLRCAGRLFSVPISYVEEVVQMVAVSDLPDVPWGVVGLVDYHGELITVIDLGEIVELPKSRVSPDKALVVCSLRPFRFGLMVDEATDVVTVKRQEISVTEEVLPGTLKATGVVKSEGRAAVIVDVWSIILAVQLGKLSHDIEATGATGKAGREAGS